jgi:hypothetical protein
MRDLHATEAYMRGLHGVNEELRQASDVSNDD